MQFQRSFGKLSLLAAIVLTSCSTSQENNYSAIDSEILEIHDEVMPKLEDINQYSEEIRSKINQLDSLQQEGVSSSTFAEQRLRATDILKKLQVADSLMWDWMRNYEADSAKALPKEEDIVRYFENEKAKILDVKEKTESSLLEAQEFLKD